MKPICYLDMDGVLADFEGYAATIFDNWKWEINQHGWGRFKEYPNWFELLPPMPGAKDLYEGCVEIMGDKNHVQILTALPNRAHMHMPDAARHKIEWARKHISPDIRVHFGPYAQDKQYHKQHPHDILIDDIELNIEQWNGVGGIGILYTSSEQAIADLKAVMEEIRGR